MNPKHESMKLALTKLFAQRYFSVCTIDTLAKMTNTIVDRETYGMLHAIHCVDYADMQPEFREWLFETVINMFDANGFDIKRIGSMSPKREPTTETETIVIKTRVIQPPKSFIKRLLS